MPSNRIVLLTNTVNLSVDYVAITIIPLDERSHKGSVIDSKILVTSSSNLWS